jgi:putative ABC transport system substrate-binding protein
MNRRRFLVTSLVSTFAPPRDVEAQTGRRPVVGVLSPWASSYPAAGQREPFERGLRELGWIPGSTIAIEQRYAEGRSDRLPKLAAELVQLKVDLIVANGSLAIRAVREATDTVPIVMAVAYDPVREGHVHSLARPGGNVTGLTLGAQGRLEPKQLEMLKEAVSGLTRVGVLANRSGDAAAAEELGGAARALSLRLQTFEVSRSEEIPEAFRTMTRAGVGAVLVRADPLVLDPQSAQTAALALRHRLPAIFPWLTIPGNYGGLMAYGVNMFDLHRRAASYVDRILKGAKPGDLPVEQPTKFELVINVKTSKALGLTIPQSILVRADQIIE